MPTDEPMKAAEVARILGISRNGVYKLANSGELSSYKVGKKLLFRHEDINRYLDAVHSAHEPLALSEKEAIERAINPQRDGDSFVMCGQGLSADAFVDQLEQNGAAAQRVYRTSYAGIIELYIGNADAAFVHLYDQRSNSFNTPYVQRLAPGLPVVAFRLIGRRQGFAVAKGNPDKVTSWGALLRESIILANRIQGSGARILLDEKLASMEADPYAIAGYDSEFATEASAAHAVAKGIANVAVVNQATAEEVDGIDFVPLQTEWLDLVIAKRGKGRHLIRLVREILADKAFQESYASITRGDMSHFGSVVYES